jgi:tight adherence protein B
MTVILVPVLVFATVLVLVVGGVLVFVSREGAAGEFRRRISLLEARRLQEADFSEVLRDELLSGVPALHRALARMNLATGLDRRLRQADLDMRVGTFLLLTALSGGAGLLVGILLHRPLLLGVASGILLASVPNAYVNFRRRVRVRRFMSHFPDALEMFARSLRAGHAFTGAIQMVAQEMTDPVGPEFQKVFDEQNLGVPMKDALLGLTERVDSLDVKFFVTSVLIQRETGGNLAEIIDKIAYVVRERFRIEGQVKVYTAQARMTGMILTLLPIGVALVINLVNPEFLKPLWFERMGRIMVGVALAMQVAGGLAIRKIIRIKI